MKNETLQQIILRHRDCLAAKGLSTKPNFVALRSGFRMDVVVRVLREERGESWGWSPKARTWELAD